MGKNIIEALGLYAPPNHWDLGLERLCRLMEKIGNPHTKLPPVFHVAGTNGKGSTVATLRAFIETNHQSAHVFISPHLISLNERIRLAGKLIGDDEFDVYITQIKKHLGAETPITFFEYITAVAFCAFAEKKADFTLLETGLGGRLDATNIVEKPLCSIITRLSYDHQSFLGDTIEEIAGEKAGIIKQGCPVVIGYQEYESTYAVIKRVAEEKKAPVFCYGEDWEILTQKDSFVYQSKKHRFELPYPSLSGEHQAYNAGNAIAALEITGLLDKYKNVLPQALLNIVWPARLQKLEEGKLFEKLPQGSLCYVDGGHNDSAGDVLAPFLKKVKQQNGYPVFCILGMLNNKDLKRFAQPLLPHIDGLLPMAIEGKEEGSFSCAEIKEKLGFQPVFEARNYEHALSILNGETQGKPYVLFVLGSLYQAGAFLEQNGTVLS